MNFSQKCYYNLYMGDCLDLMSYINDKSVDLVLCDLPYGTTASNWDKEIPMKYLWEHYDRILKPTGTVILFANGIFTPRVMASNIEEYKYRLVWIKNNSTNFVHAKNRPLVKSEDILIFSKGSMGHKSLLGDKRMTYNPQGLIPCRKVIKQGKSRFGTVTGNRPSHLHEDETFVREWTNYPCDVIMDIPDLPPNKKLHTNEKPVPLLEYLIKTYSNEGDMVLDNCMGSGSTGVASINTNRRFYGIEINTEYFEVAKNRICEADRNGDDEE